MPQMILWQRKLIEVNTDPQRRCYWGVHAKSELVWTKWAEFTSVPIGREEAQLAYWRELNDYAVSQRGRANTACEYQLVPEGQQPAE